MCRPTRPRSAAPRSTRSPPRKRKRGRRGSLIAPEEPGENLSKKEFDELVRDLDIEGVGGEGPPGRPRQPRRARRRRARNRLRDRCRARQGQPARERPARKPAAESPPPAPTPSDPAADLTPEDLVLKDSSKQRKKHATDVTGGLADGGARLGHDGPRDLAFHDLRARPLLGRDRGGLRRGAARGGRDRGGSSTASKVSGLHIPSKKATDIAVVLYAVPGALIGIAAVYVEGLRRERAKLSPGA